MKYDVLRLAMVGVLILSVQVAGGDEQLSLKDALSAAMQQRESYLRGNYLEEYRSSPWLAESPSLGLSVLESRKHQGSDEAELSLNLPIKSGFQRGIDRQLSELIEQNTQISIRQRQLYFSGLIRQSIWSYEIAQLKYTNAQRKAELLQHIEENYLELVKANAVSEYGLLLVQKELVDTNSQLLGFRREADKWLQQYRDVTGMVNLPEDTVEPDTAPEQLTLPLHPAIQALELGWQQQEALLLANSNRSSPWNLSVSAKQIDAPGFSDRQIGFGLELPVTLLKITSQSQKNEWLDARKQYELERDALYIQIQQRWNSLIKEAQLLKGRENFLIRELALANQIQEKLSLLQSHNEMGQEITLRRMLDVIQTQAKFSLHQVLKNRNRAMLRQAAGISL